MELILSVRDRFVWIIFKKKNEIGDLLGYIITKEAR